MVYQMINRILSKRKLRLYSSKMLKVLSVFLFLSVMPIKAGTFLQETLSFNFKNTSIKNIFAEIEKASEYRFLFTGNLDNSLEKKVTVKTESNSLTEILDIVVKNTNLKYNIVDKQIIVSSIESAKLVEPKEINQYNRTIKIRGKVYEADTTPLVGVTIIVKGTNLGTTTDVNGAYEIDIPLEGLDGAILQFSYIGFKVKEIAVDESRTLPVLMEEDLSVIGEVVVTGYYERKKDSFTGAITSYKGEELISINNQNILSSLSMVSPSFKMIESNIFGSDPNRIPDFQIRGGSSLSTSLESDFSNSPNMPTFIMDGFEVTAQKVFDFDPNRIESITILKDAAATAIYGSRAANGVVVIETKSPKSGEMKISYTLNMDFDAADLSDYNLMNSSEKLEYERLAGLYDHRAVYIDDQYKQSYNDRLRLVKMGVDTDWLAKPVRQLGVGTKHSLLLEGGDNILRYAVNLNYSHTAGVMKGSDRDRTGISVRLQYNLKRLRFVNTLSYDNVKNENSNYGNFGQYTYLNPYFYPYDINGNINEILFVFSDGKKEVNPLYNTNLNSKDNSKYNNFTNNFSIEWLISDSFRFTARLALLAQTGLTNFFKPSEHTDFINTVNKGIYTKTSSEEFSYDANAVLSYSKNYGKHLINAAGIYNIYEKKDDRYSVTGQNYPNANMDHVGMGTQYLEGGRPTGDYSITRLIGLVANGNYSFNNRYMVDLSMRGDASSLFGSNNRWGLFFAGGLGWNLHNENFISKTSWINLLKLRGSWGETGGIKFNPYQWMMMYSYNDNDIYGITYNNKIGALLMALGNPNLLWQKKEKLNVGLDFELFSSKLTGSLNIYREISKNQLVDVTLAPSLGFPTYMDNLGKVMNEGIELSLKSTLLKGSDKLYQWDVFTNVFHNKNRLIQINNALTAFNDKQDELAASPSSPINRPMVKYQEGRSMNTIWVVESLGIDPATGKEIFINRNGEIVSEYNFKDQKPLGSTDPYLEGNFGTILTYKGFQFSGYFSFKFGGDLYNQTLVDKVENVDPLKNADKRVLYDRWKNQGDIARFKSISDKSTTNPSSRFLEKDNEIRFSSLSVSYLFDSTFLERTGIERLKLTAMTNDLYRFNSSKIERGISYPFSRYFSFAAQITF